MGGSPKPDPFKPNTYNIKVYKNSFAGLSETSEQASEQAKEFCGPNKYTAYRRLTVVVGFVGTHDTHRVEFTRIPVENLPETGAWIPCPVAPASD